MISGRTLAQGIGCESKMTQEYFQAASICSLSESEYKKLKTNRRKEHLGKKQIRGSSIIISNGFRSPSRHNILSLWSVGKCVNWNRYDGVRYASFKGIEVEVEYTDSNVKDIRSLFNDLLEKVRSQSKVIGAVYSITQKLRRMAFW